MNCRRASSQQARGMLQGDHANATMHGRRVYGGSGRMEMALMLEDRMRYATEVHCSTFSCFLFLFLFCVETKREWRVSGGDSLANLEVKTSQPHGITAPRTTFFL